MNEALRATPALGARLSGGDVVALWPIGCQTRRRVTHRRPLVARRAFARSPPPTVPATRLSSSRPVRDVICVFPGRLSYPADAGRHRRHRHGGRADGRPPATVVPGVLAVPVQEHDRAGTGQERRQADQRAPAPARRHRRGGRHG